MTSPTRFRASSGLDGCRSHCNGRAMSGAGWCERVPVNWELDRHASCCGVSKSALVAKKHVHLYLAINVAQIRKTPQNMRYITHNRQYPQISSQEAYNAQISHKHAKMSTSHWRGTRCIVNFSTTSQAACKEQDALTLTHTWGGGATPWKSF